MGSPPHMRGKVGRGIPGEARTGITPAHAGKRISFFAQTLKNWDHPRTCGEKHFSPDCRCLARGSPPHMRGKGVNNNVWEPGAGITPAHAGKSYCMSRTSVTGVDHPRTCGEKASITIPRWPSLGSPPHMRGKEESKSSVSFRFGITPAHAGKRFYRFYPLQ